MICAAQCRDHLPWYKVPTAVTLCAVQALVVCCADVLATLLEESGMCQITATHWQKERETGIEINMRSLPWHFSREITGRKGWNGIKDVASQDWTCAANLSTTTQHLIYHIYGPWFNTDKKQKCLFLRLDWFLNLVSSRCKQQTEPIRLY